MLYTVRDDCARDYEGTLRAVAGTGYEGVELFDFHSHDPMQLRRSLDDVGLVACGCHAGLDAIEARLPELSTSLEALGTRRLVVSWIEPPNSLAGARETIDRLRRAAREASGLGLELGFHNHAPEVRPLESGTSFLDELLDTAPEVFLELDLGWAWYGGVDPELLLTKAPGRSPLVHVKDFRARAEHSFCPVGEGAVGYERLPPPPPPAGGGGGGRVPGRDA